MSESTPTSESVSGNTAPGISPTPKKGKSLWMMIAAIVVAVILVSVVFLVVDWGGDDDGPDVPTEDEYELDVTVSPTGTITVGAGESVTVSVSTDLVNLDTDESTSVDSWTNVTYYWTRSPITLGSFDLSGNREVEFTGAESAATGTISCKVTYDGIVAYGNASVEVEAPYLVSVSVTPTSKTLGVDQAGTFQATAYDSVNDPMTGATFAWTVFGLDSGDYTLNTTTGAFVTFTPETMPEGDVLLNVTATSGSIDVSATSTITVTEEPIVDERTLDYYWYDIFKVPFGEWYDYRDDEIVWTSSETAAPYLYDWYGSEPGNIWTYTNMRLDITGTNMPEINTNDDPYFVPQLGTTTGGNVVLDWYMTYLTYEQAEEWPNVKAWYDGWEAILTGTVTLDEEAAVSVLGMPADQWDTFDTWWAANQLSVISQWEQWLDDQGNIYYDIWAMYEWTLQQMVFEIDAEKVGDTVVLTQRHVSWGMDALMARWLRAAFMDDHEWYMEDFSMHAEIGPEKTDLEISAAVEYAAYAYETTDEGLPCWMWETLKGDYMTTDDCPDDDHISEYDVYSDKTYLNWAPGSEWYGEWMTYDYTPGLLNLSEGETLRFAWPDADQLFVVHVEPGVYDTTTGPMTLDYAEPRIADFPTQISIDTTERVLTFEGPIDMFAWSRDQTWQTALSDEWERIGLLPYGAPTIEFRLDEAKLASSAVVIDDVVPEDDAPAELDAPSGAAVSSTPVTEASAAASASSEVSALVAIAVSMFLVLLALGQCLGRADRKR